MHNFLTLLALLLTLHGPLAAHASDAEGKGEAGGPFYHSLSPSLVSNLTTGGKYLRCDVQLMTENAAALPDIQLHAPALRHELLMLLSEQDGAKLKTPDGREELRKQALEAVRKVMREQTGRNAVDDLFFTAFFVQ